MMIRYFVHGDIIDEIKDKYYCAFCDLSFQVDHFKEFKHVDSNEKKFVRTIRNWRILKEKFPNSYYRPNDCINLFSDLPNIKIKKSHFYNWLIKQQKREDPIGDLASDILRDPFFPVESSSKISIRNYLLNKTTTCDEAFQAFNEAFKEFDKKKTNRQSISLSLRFEIFRRDNYKCQICGRSVKEDNVILEVDHKIPIIKGGDSDESNLWTLCFNCNRGKGIKKL